MRLLLLIGLSACAFAAMPMVTVAAMPFSPTAPAVTQVDNNIIMVARGGHGHHYGWTRSHGRHLGFVRGRHLAWR
jgi:hypothetical protein